MNSQMVIAGSAFEEPTEFYTSNAIEDMLNPLYERLKLPKGRLEELTGIQKRGCYSADLSPGEIASFSVKKLLKKMELRPKDIDVLIYSGVCRDALEPSTSSQVHHRCELKADCLHFDVSNACLGMMSAIHLAHKLLADPQINRVIVTTGENSQPMLNTLIKELNTNQTINRKNIKPHIASLTLGSASLSLLISKCSLYPTATKICDFHWKTDTSAYNLCQALGDYWHPRMQTDSEHLLEAGVALGKKLWSDWSESKKEACQFYLIHQVGKAHEQVLRAQLGLSTYSTFITYPDYGNTGSAAVALTWHLAQEKNLFPKGSRGVWLGIGSGLNAMLMEIEH
jgi:3-oxoacyl-[acyl-carrier-protein] synthase III